MNQHFYSELLMHKLSILDMCSTVTNPDNETHPVDCLNVSLYVNDFKARLIAPSA